MVSCVISYNGVSKPFFIDPQKAKVTGAYYTRHLERDLLPECLKLYPANDYIFMQDGATSHTSNLCQNKLRELRRAGRFISKTQWPPKSCDLNPVDYYFWDAVNKLVYANRKEPFENLAQLSRKIRSVWTRAINMTHIKKAIDQFIPCCKKVVECEADPITQYFS